MKIEAHTAVDPKSIEGLFEFVFTDSEGAEEGRLVGRLAAELMSGTPSDELRGFVALEGGELVGAIFFSRMRFADESTVFLLAPVAVDSDHQGKGVGQALIRGGLEAMRKEGAEVVLTYGDQAFYSKVGFEAVSIEQIPAPFPLSMPHGWQGLSLGEELLGTLPGPSGCVGAFDDPALW